MKRLKDVICDECNYREEGLFNEDYGMCPDCGKPLRQDYANKRVGLSIFANSKFDTAGNLQTFAVKEDCMAQYELGLKRHSDKYSVLDAGQRIDLRAKYERDGDSVSLRKEIKRERENAQSAKGSTKTPSV